MNLKEPLVELGFKGKFLAHWMAWHGEPFTGDLTKVHKPTGYISTSRYTISRQLDAMQAAGIDGVIATYMGARVNPFIHRASAEMSFQCWERSMTFGLLLDPWICKGWQAQGYQSAEDAVLQQLLHPEVQGMMKLNNYLKGQQGPLVLEFSTGADYKKISQTLPVTFLSKHVGFSWPEVTNTLSSLEVDNAGAAMQIPAVCLGFNDGGRALNAMSGVLSRDYNASVWGGGPVRIIEPYSGTLYQDTIYAIPLAQMPYVALVTWNDVDEGTDVEKFVSACTGIRIF